ncbi:MAG: VOC family protein [Acidobacteriota bacterium]|nr:VOC family protein [Acidobacteriota bacterium]
MATIRLGGVGLDCDDPVRLSDFWASLLGGEIVYTSPSLAVVKLGDLYVNAYRVEDHRPPTWPGGPVPKQAHLDLDVDDLAAAEQRAITLGARRADWQPEPDSYLVLLDPAGHPFCLSTQFPD